MPRPAGALPIQGYEHFTVDRINVLVASSLAATVNDSSLSRCRPIQTHRSKG